MILTSAELASELGISSQPWLSRALPESADGAWLHRADIVDLIEKVVRVSVESAKLIGQIDGKVEKKSKKMEFVYSTEEDIDSDLPMAAEEAEEWKK